MARFVVEGGTPLRGEITPQGNKNEALPLIAAALLTEEPVTLRNLPRIRDVRGMLEIAAALGAKVEELDPRTVRITGAIRSTEVPQSLAAVLAQGRTVMHNAASEPHVQQLSRALVRMGAQIQGIGTNMLTIDGVDRLSGIEHTILSDHMEVGSLIGAIAMTRGQVTIKN